METFFCLMLALALFDLPVGDVVGIPRGEQVLSLPMVLPAAPRGLTQAERAGLRGPVRTVRADSTPLADAAWQQPPLAMQFDARGAMTAVIRGHPQRQPEACAITHQYDPQNRLQQSTLTVRDEGTPQGEVKTKVEIQRSYDAHGRLTELRAVMPPRAIFVSAFTYDAEGRLNGQRVTVEPTGDKPLEWLKSTYRDERDGVTVAETMRELPATKVIERQRYDAHGRLVEWLGCDEHGTVRAKLDVHYNEHGDLLRFNYNEKERATCAVFGDYVYDAHGNWTARTLSSIEQRAGKDVTTPVLTQTRTLTYHE